MPCCSVAIVLETLDAFVLSLSTQLTVPFVQKATRTVPLLQKEQKPPKLQRCCVETINNDFEKAINQHGTITVGVELFQSFLSS